MSKAKYLVQEVQQYPTRDFPAGGIVEEYEFATKDEGEARAREIRAAGGIAYLWHLTYIKDKKGEEHRNRQNGETLIPWRDFA